MVVAACAGHGKSQQSASDCIDALVALIGAALHRLRLVPHPGTCAEIGRRDQIVVAFGGGLEGQTIAGQLHGEKAVVG